MSTAIWLLAALMPLQSLAKTTDCSALLAPKTGYIYAFGSSTEHIQFGFESEYSLDEIDGLLQFYAPEFDAAAERQAWAGKTPAERSAWVREQYGKKPEFAEQTKLKLQAVAPEMSFLPEHLLLDATGNLEIVLPPVDTLAEWTRQVELVNSRIGVGSMQAMLSSPRVNFYGKVNGLDEKRAIAQNLGWLAFTADLDVLIKLENGAQRFAKDSSKEVARSFMHPWLGPLTKLKWDKIREFLGKNIQGEWFDKETLKYMKTDASFKYIGGTAYRPDIAGPDRVAVELRSAHKDYKLLAWQVARDTRSLANDRTPYEKFASVAPFDTKTLWERLPTPVLKMLEKLFPSRVDPRFSYTGDERLALDMYRNFYYPMRDWSGYLRAMGGSREKVTYAQWAYVEKLAGIERNLKAGKIDAAAARVQVQGALVQFAVDSGLVDLFREYLTRIQNGLAAVFSGRSSLAA